MLEDSPIQDEGQRRVVIRFVVVRVDQGLLGRFIDKIRS